MKGPQERVCCYHLMGRIGQEVPGLTALEKEVLRKQIGAVCEFAGVKLVTYCVMDSHFHVLVEVPGKKGPHGGDSGELRGGSPAGPASVDGVVGVVDSRMLGSRDEPAPRGSEPADSAMLDDEEILRRTQAYYAGRTTAHTVAYIALVEAAWAEGGEAWRAMRARLMRRMGDISTLMQQLKQRFAIFVNKTRGRRGALWSERFRSVIVEGAATAVGAMAAYIDLNPVRAGLAKDPKDYRFCGYAEAVAGGERARAGIGALTGGKEWERAGELYRQLLLGKGRMAKPGAGRLPMGAKERLGLADLLRCRARYLTDGAVLGSREFVEDWYRSWRMKPPKRLTGARRMRGGDWGGLCVYRDLQTRVLEATGAL